jgi:hypothetical protein
VSDQLETHFLNNLLLSVSNVVFLDVGNVQKYGSLQSISPDIINSTSSQWRRQTELVDSEGIDHSSDDDLFSKNSARSYTNLMSPHIPILST